MATSIGAVEVIFMLQRKTIVACNAFFVKTSANLIYLLLFHLTRLQTQAGSYKNINKN